MSKFSKKSSYQDHIAFLDNSSEEFKDIIKLVNNKDKPIVIVIDDLDRCLPEKALHILEGIKLFLDIEPCVYLLALDREFIEKIVLSKFKGLRIDKDSVRKLSEGYIEKFVQLQIAVPPVDKSVAKNFIKDRY
jgi:predicted KAP-like P-loop ATPase